jgi:hypothetical protein
MSIIKIMVVSTHKQPTQGEKRLKWAEQATLEELWQDDARLDKQRIKQRLARRKKKEQHGTDDERESREGV